MSSTTTGYAAEIERWRQALEALLRHDWVSLVGRFELQPGPNRVGADPAAEVALPAGSAPELVGVLTFDGEVTLDAVPGAPLLVNGAAPAGPVTLRSDAAGAPDLVTLGSLTLFVIQRGGRTIVRVRDSASPALQRFGGRRWFPVDEAYCVEGRFTPYDPPKPLAIANVLGDTSPQLSPGAVTFVLGEQEQRLDATGWRDGGLVLHFHDATNGALTYGGGRSLVTSSPRGGLVTIDFNRTTNLPCVVTPFATCPLPPQQNRLRVRVEAGELLPDMGES